MKAVRVLMRPRLLSFKNRRGGGKARLAAAALIGLLLWGGLLAVSLRLLAYFRSIEALGDILAWKLLSMVFVVYFSLLLYSSVLTALSKLFMSRDLALVHSMPVRSYEIFCARWIESTMDSSWTIIIFTLPVLIAYGVAYEAGPAYYPLLIISLLLLSLIASAISAALVMLGVILIPPGRMKSIFVLLGLLLFLLLYLAFRMIRPERLVDPEAFETFLAYLRVLETPSYPMLPPTWAFDAVRAALSGLMGGAALNLSLLTTCAGALLCAVVLLSDALYARGMSRSQTADRTWRSARATRTLPFLRLLPRPVQAWVTKEIRTFFRDQTQWSQLFLIAGLVVIYVFNFKVLPLDRAPVNTVYLQNVLAFVNMGLASFVLTAVTGRFAYPAVSLEGEAFWIVLSSPLRLRTFLWVKYLVYFFPLLILTEVLIVATNLLLQVSPFMMWLSSATILCIAPAVVALGIGLGAAYPDFNAENAAQAVTSFGGLVFMLLSAGFITVVIVLEAGPVYRIVMSGLTGRELSAGQWLWIVGAFLLAALISAVTVILPMALGLENLSKTSRHEVPAGVSKPFRRRSDDRALESSEKG